MCDANVKMYNNDSLFIIVIVIFFFWSYVGGGVVVSVDRDVWFWQTSFSMVNFDQTHVGSVLDVSCFPFDFFERTLSGIVVSDKNRSNA
jgi:preprotein translocase subunit SecF